MANKRQCFTADFKRKVAIEALKERNALNEVASDFQVHPSQVARWKKMLIDGSHDIFKHGNSKESQSKKQEKKDSAALKKIGQQALEIDWLKNANSGGEAHAD